MQPHRLVAPIVLLAAFAVPAKAATVLRVNGVEISAGQLAISTYKVTYDTPSLTGAGAKLTAVAVDQLVADVLLDDAARAAGMAISGKEFKQGIATLQAKLGGTKAYRDLLQQLGASEDELGALAQRRMLARRYVETTVAPKVTVSDAEARAYYESPENQVYHGEQILMRIILVNAPPGISAGEEAKARARIDEAERRIVAGEDFAKVASEVSDDMSRSRGGDTGWIGSEALPAQFLGRVWALQPGEMSEVMRGQFSFGLVQVVDKRPRGPFTFDEMKDQVITQLRKSKVDAAVAAVVASRRAGAQIEALTPEVAAALKQ
jgi:peptidyl-prolyl cis-trans isomerase C